jgi:hypothetical protein
MQDKVDKFEKPAKPEKKDGKPKVEINSKVKPQVKSDISKSLYKTEVEVISKPTVTNNVTNKNSSNQLQQNNEYFQQVLYF